MSPCTQKIFIYDKPDKVLHRRATRGVLEGAAKSKTFSHNLPCHNWKVSFRWEDESAHEHEGEYLVDKIFHKFCKQMVSKLAESVHED